MQVITSGYTIAEYCGQMEEGKIVVNRDYQRSNKVWPPAARSYLIDTILRGFPMPKLSLYQRTDVKSRRTTKEIVDGQQRSETILSFFRDQFRISGKYNYASGKTFSQLDTADQATFLEYTLGVDIFVGATQEHIREVFRRMNSYMVPLNPQEKRHATYQGAFKWFIVDLTDGYAQVLKDIGVFSEKQLSRMRDAQLLGEIVIALSQGITTQNQRRVDEFYEKHEQRFDDKPIRKRLDLAFERILTWEDIHKTALMRHYTFYTLLLAILHSLQPVPSLMDAFALQDRVHLQDEIVLTNLTSLAEAVEDRSDAQKYKDFVWACSAATNTLKRRRTRFQFLCRGLQPPLM